MVVPEVRFSFIGNLLHLLPLIAMRPIGAPIQLPSDGSSTIAADSKRPTSHSGPGPRIVVTAAYWDM